MTALVRKHKNPLDTWAIRVNMLLCNPPIAVRALAFGIFKSDAGTRIVQLFTTLDEGQ